LRCTEDRLRSAAADAVSAPQAAGGTVMQPHLFGVFDQDGSIAKENVGKVVDHFRLSRSAKCRLASS
ncbi:hypothetical protein, partial [Mesorhizobium sp.]|uniref:hypothetical protein n=1 Tax=Mesorhizobium sp. TaxID=1871066 RepID=UPI00257FE861